MAEEQLRLRRLRGTNTVLDNFYDCGAYGLYALPTERWQPEWRGKKSNPDDFKADPTAPINDPIWTRLGPIVAALDGKVHVLDVGGYIGTFTIPMALSAARRGYRLTFDIFEPGPTRHLLAKNLVLNGLSDQITLHDAAMSKDVGKTTYRWRGNGAIGGQVFAKAGTTDRRRVATVTVDHVAKAMEGPLLIKLDTQGHEASIMSAARETIAAKKAIWHIEFVWWHVRDKFDGARPFYRYLFDEFLVFEGGKQIAPVQADTFMSKLKTRKFGMTDLTLVPKGAWFTDRVIQAVR